MDLELESAIIKIIESLGKHYATKDIYAKKRSKMSIDLLYLTNPSLSHIQVAEITNKSINSIRDWRIRNYPEVIYSKYFKCNKRYDEYEENLLQKENLSNLEISKLTGRSVPAIQDARNRRCDMLKFEELSKYKNKSSILNISESTIISKFKRYKMSEIIDIVNSPFNSKQLAIEYGRTIKSIYSIQNKYKYLKINIDK